MRYYKKVRYINALTVIFTFTFKAAIYRRQRIVWVRSYLRTKLSIMCIAAYYLTWTTCHREKFKNFLRMDLDDFKELFRLVELSIK